MRAAQDRRVRGAGQARLGAAVEAAALQEERAVGIARTPKRAAHTARLEMRFCRLEILPPRHARERRRLSAVPLWAVWVREANAPGAETPIQWLLLSTRPIHTCGQAWRAVEAYRKRWRVERFHFVLKSGCRIEALQVETAERLKRALALSSILAWRLLWLC